MMTQRNRRRLLRLGQLAALAVMAVLGLVDLNAGMGDRNALGLLLLQVLTAIATAAVWLPAHRQGSVRLPRLTLALAGWSVILTVLIVANRALDPNDSYGSSSWGLAESFGLLGVLFVVSRRGKAPVAAAAAAAAGIALSLLPARGGENVEFIIAGMFLALCGSGAIGGGVYLRTLDSNRQRAVDTVRAEQRAEFARDLHDFIAHHVTGIVVQAQGARFIAEQDPKRVLLALEQIENAGAETMASMRRMVGVLRDPNAAPDAPLTPLAGVAELGPLLEGFSSSGGPVSRLHVDGELTGLPVEVSTSAYRVVMEALTNIRQHATNARVVDVWVRRTPDWLLVRIANDGTTPRNAPPRERHGYGLVGLTERVRAVGGRITAEPGIDGGWVVDAALPLDQEVSR
jgi:signal transduction histidine kinase